MNNDKDFDTLDRLQPKGGTFRNGRRTPETIYASLDDNLDDRSTNFSVTWVPDVELARFFVKAANEKLERMRRPADPEAWLADQLAQLQLPGGAMDLRNDACLEPGPNYGRWISTLIPGSPSFEAVQKLAQEYGEMCAARATEGLESVVTEHGEAFKSGDVKVWDESESDIYPVASRIAQHQRQGGVVLRRKVVVVEGWGKV